MYEYLNYFTPDIWQSLIYILIAFGAAFYLISLGISGLFTTSLSENAKSSPIKTTVMCFSQAMVCLLIIANFFLPLHSTHKVALTLIMFIFTYTARYYYWRNLSELYNEKSILRGVYNTIVFGAIGMCVIHLLWLSIKGVNSCCLGDVVKYNPATSYILKVQIPFLMNDTFTFFVKFFTISVSIVYIRFFILSLYTRDKIMIAGLFVSVLNILYTTSYHAFGFKYWVPLYFIVDLLEYTRLQQLEMSHFKLKLNKQKNSFRMMLHDLSNPLLLNSLRLKKLQRNTSDTSHRDVDALMQGTQGAIDLLNNFKGLKSELAPVSDIIYEVTAIFPEVNFHYKRPNNEVHLHKGLIKNSLINLIKNSKEALGDKLEWIRIIVDNEDDKLIIKLIDNGKYSNIKDPQKIFEMGQSTKGPGRGLGLSSIKEEIEAVNGRLSLGDENSFTCFKITI